MGNPARPHSFQDLPADVREALRALVRTLARQAAEDQYRRCEGVRDDTKAS